MDSQKLNLYYILWFGLIYTWFDWNEIAANELNSQWERSSWSADNY